MPITKQAKGQIENFPENFFGGKIGGWLPWLATCHLEKFHESPAAQLLIGTIGSKLKVDMCDVIIPNCTQGEKSSAAWGMLAVLKMCNFAILNDPGTHITQIQIDAAHPQRPMIVSLWGSLPQTTTSMSQPTTSKTHRTLKILAPLRENPLVRACTWASKWWAWDIGN